MTGMTINGVARVHAPSKPRRVSKGDVDGAPRHRKRKRKSNAELAAQIAAGGVR